MAAAMLGREDMADVLRRWGYVDPDSILALVDANGFAILYEGHTERAVYRERTHYLMYVD